MKLAPIRILVVDDNADIHRDFEKVLLKRTGDAKHNALEEQLFGKAPTPASEPCPFEIVHAFQGEEALEVVKRAKREHKPITLAFVDVRMPPGWDGVKTIAEIRKISPEIAFVVCTAYSDYEPAEAGEKAGLSDGLAFVGKPFDPSLVRSFAEAAARVAQEKTAA